MQPSDGSPDASPPPTDAKVSAPDGAGDGKRPERAFSVGSYNVLCSTYAVKWGEREGVGPDGNSNWPARWPVMRDVILRASWDVVCLQEVEQADCGDIVSGLGERYSCHYFKHEVRPPDGVMIAVRADAFEEPVVHAEAMYKGCAFGRADLVHRVTGRRVRVLTSHCRGGNAEQLAALADFAEEGNTADVTVVTGDFNEDFCPDNAGEVRCFLPEGPLGRYATLLREPGLPPLSRPPHKQAEDQKSGKGKVDWIFVRGRAPDCAVELFRDEASRAAVLESHRACEATGQWPSDHGVEALSVRFA